MKRPENFSIGSIEIRLFDVGTNDLTLKALNDGNGAYLEMMTTGTGVVLERGDLREIADLGEALLNLYESMEESNTTPSLGLDLCTDESECVSPQTRQSPGEQDRGFGSNNSTTMELT